MKILSIESSADETGVSILEVKVDSKEPTFRVLGNGIASQIELHTQYGGIYPALAKREHQKNLPILLDKVLKKTKLDKKKKPVDVIAVTYGPGLEPALWTGIVIAKELAEKWNVPLIPVNHMEGHALSVFGKNKGTFKIPKVAMPALALLVSGGHTELVLIEKWMNYKIVGQTLDDAVGEAFDKVARMLGLPYPGGPEISKIAEGERKQVLEGVRSATGARLQQFSNKKIAYPEKLSFPFSLPRPMLYSKNFDFSYSGLKTAVLYLIKDLGGLEKLDDKTKAQIALEFENAAIECLIHKTRKVIEKYKIKTILVGGGVSANKYLRSEMKKLVGKNIKLLFPTKELSTDNSMMIGIAGYLNFIKNKKKVPKPNTIKATGNLRLN